MQGKNLLWRDWAWLYLSRSEDIQQIIAQLRGLGDIQEINKVLSAFQQPRPSENNPELLTENLEEINAIFSLGSVPEILEKCKSDSSEFSCKILTMLERCSPTSLNIAFLQLRKGRATYQEALEVEYRLMSRRFLDADFYEGVRAALIDKDHQPVWSPATAQVQQYFDQLDVELELGEELQ